MLRAVILYAVVALGVPLSIFEPFYGLLLYLFFAHAHPADFVWTGYIFNYGMVLAPALLVGYLIFEVRKSPLRLRGMLLVLAFWVWLGIASILAYDHQPAYDILIRFSKIFVISILVATMVNSIERAGAVLRIVAISLGLLGLKGLVDIIITRGKFRMQGPGGLMSEENEYALGMNMAIPILFSLSQVEERAWLRRCYKLAAGACAAVVVFTYSRSGLLGLIVVCGLLALYSKRKLLAPAALAVAAAIFLFVAPEGAIERYKTIPTASETDPSAIGRLQMWETAILMTKAHPFFGVGPRNFELSVPKYSGYEPRAPHNAFMALMAESGVPSCLLFILIVLSASTISWLNWRRLRGDPANRTLSTYCLIVHITLLVYLVPNLFINRQDFDLMYHLVGLSAGMNLVVRRVISERLASQRASITLEAWTNPASLPPAEMVGGR
jgi:probable O-glycosylation ligase (exosortase A-associated)